MWYQQLHATNKNHRYDVLYALRTLKLNRYKNRERQANHAADGGNRADESAVEETGHY